MIMLGNDAYEWRSLLNIIPINNILVNCGYLSGVMENFRVPLLLYKAKFIPSFYYSVLLTTHEELLKGGVLSGSTFLWT